ncbi:hypothetical protein [Polynucleobacter sp. JS-Fieb-80-E5]|uniref:hypothetical protein n=1 Tax=Polynucleobacter sp. JS-Fieb-80-E5 TaxID=2081050 RepID=UPI002102B7DC|nr:hypothetical protein [Polynucleobacter sp. JS-Fieb-80-E5]
MREVAIRGFINEKFGSTFGKGLFRRALYTGSVELHNPKQKYLVDFYTYADWEFSAKSDEQIAVLKKLDATDIAKTPNILMSWLVHYDPLTKCKSAADGFCIYAQDTKELHLNIDDAHNGVMDEWTLDVQHCKTAGHKKPVFIAANVDLTVWH